VTRRLAKNPATTQSSSFRSATRQTRAIDPSNQDSKLDSRSSLTTEECRKFSF